MLRSLTQTLESLADRPAALFAVVVAVAALSRPYAGMYHDARVYAGQAVLAAEPELLANDLFFRYGSQSRFSAFGAVMAPMVNWLGIDLAFFLAHLASVAVFFAGAIRLASVAAPNRLAIVVGLIILAAAPIPYGGRRIFHVFESFLTPRMIGSGLTMASLAFALEGGAWRSATALAVALAIHPLMAFPGTLVVAGWAAHRYGGWRLIGWSSAALASAAAIVLATPTLAGSIFGVMDEEWHEQVRFCSPYLFPADWEPDDWVWTTYSLLVVAIAGWRWRSEARGVVFGLAALFGFAGLVGSAVVSELRYALPMMGQPYRTLWLVSALAPVATASVAIDWWSTRRTGLRFAALALAWPLAMSESLALHCAAAVLFVPAGAMIARMMRWGETRGDRAVAVALTSMVLTMAFWGVFRGAVFVGSGLFFAPSMEIANRYVMVVLALGSGILATLAMLLAYGLARVPAAAIALALAWHGGFFAFCASRYADQIGMGRGDDRDLVAAFLRDKPRPTTVYTNTGRLDWTWLRWRAQSYFDVNQTVGIVFARETATESHRRALLAGPFDILAHRPRKAILHPDIQKGMERLLGQPFDGPPPTREDLLRLASDPELDYVALWSTEGAFDDLAEIRGRDVRIFDAAKLRAHAARGLPDAPAAHAKLSVQ